MPYRLWSSREFHIPHLIIPKRLTTKGNTTTPPDTKLGTDWIKNLYNSSFEWQMYPYIYELEYLTKKSKLTIYAKIRDVLETRKRHVSDQQLFQQSIGIKINKSIKKSINKNHHHSSIVLDLILDIILNKIGSIYFFLLSLIKKCT